MMEVGQKMALLTQRIAELEESNVTLKLKHERVANSNMKAIEILQKLDDEKAELQETELKWTRSKGDLEKLLKEVMAKKEKEVSKENMSK